MRGDRAVHLVAEAARDPLHPPIAEQVPHGPARPRIPRCSAFPGREGRVELLCGAVAVDAPVLAARAGDRRPGAAFTACRGAARTAQDPRAVGAVLVSP